MRHLTVARALSLLGLGLCSGLLVETLTGGSGCGPSGGCDDVLRSSWSRPLGVPLPIYGLLLFASLLTLSLMPGRWPGRLFRAAALLGGAGALALLIVQGAVIGRFCSACVVVDLTAIASAIAAFAGPVGETSSQAPRWYGGAALSAALGPLVFWMASGWEVPPPEVRALRHPERVTIVEVVNFRCGHCRITHRLLNGIQAELKDRIHRVSRFVAALEREDDRLVARHLLCARRQGREGQLLDALLLTEGPAEERCREGARMVGLDLSELKTCLGSVEVDEEQGWLNAAAARGLPIIWIDDVRFTGRIGLVALRDAILRAEARRSTP